MTENRYENPLIVQSDRTILLDLHSPQAAPAREKLAHFAELVKSPEYVHTFRLTPLSIWNACAAGVTADDMIETLMDFARYPPPEFILSDLRDLASRYGRVVLEKNGEYLELSTLDAPTAALFARDKKIAVLLEKQLTPLRFRISPAHRGLLKQALVEAGYPADDRAGFTDGDALPIALSPATRTGNPFCVRDYQRDGDSSSGWRRKIPIKSILSKIFYNPIRITGC